MFEKFKKGFDKESQLTPCELKEARSAEKNRERISELIVRADSYQECKAELDRIIKNNEKKIRSGARRVAEGVLGSVMEGLNQFKKGYRLTPEEAQAVKNKKREIGYFRDLLGDASYVAKWTQKKTINRFKNQTRNLPQRVMDGVALALS
jgi:uncharacterized membrane protein YgaE (UPF0421/DUF939 family)